MIQAAEPDPRVDAYIEAAAPFARPILRELRKRLHAAHPGLGETMKWSMPFFTWSGRPLAHMAAFKAHCAFGFWQGRQVADTGRHGEAMGQFGRICTPAEVPRAAQLKALAQKAAALIDEGVRPARARKNGAADEAGAAKPAPRGAPDMPADLAAALRGNPAARRTYEALAPSKQREYVEWLEEAKREDTRARRLAQALEWLAEGKSRHWKYQSC